MNNDIEQQLMTILLNRPNLVMNLNADWFENQYYQWEFDAIKELVDQPDQTTIAIYGRLKFEHPEADIKLSNLNDLKKQFITDSNADYLVSQLHLQSLKRQLSKVMDQWKQAPVAENEELIAETLSAMKNVSVIADTGSLDDQLHELDERLDKLQGSGIKSYKGIDRLLSGGLYGGMLFTIGARPSVGKTAFSVNLAYQITKNDPDVHVDYFTLEMNKREMTNRLVSRHTGISSSQLRNPAKVLNDTQKAVVRDALDYYRGLHIKVYDKTPDLNQINSIIRRNAVKCKANKYVAIIDYIGLINVSSINKSERYLQVGEITRQLKITANEFDIPIVALSQLNRSIESRQDKTPQLSDLRESGSVEQDSSAVAFLHRPDDDNRELIKLIMAKNREGEVGTLEFHFSGQEMLFQELTTWQK